MVSKLPVQSSDLELQSPLYLIGLSDVSFFVQQLLEDSFLHHILTLYLTKDSYINISFMTLTLEKNSFINYIPVHSYICIYLYIYHSNSNSHSLDNYKYIQ